MIIPLEKLIVILKKEKIREKIQESDYERK